MSRLGEELRVIPWPAWAIAACLWVGCILLLVLVSFRSDEDMQSWPLPGKILFGVVIPLITSAGVLLVGYVNGDARRRGMRHVLWTLLAIFIPNAIGIVLYFILRDPPLRACPKCGKNTSSGFPFCPACGAALTPVCPECRRPLQPGWSHCAQCGAQAPAA